MEVRLGDNQEGNGRGGFGGADLRVFLLELGDVFQESREIRIFIYQVVAFVQRDFVRTFSHAGGTICKPPAQPLVDPVWSSKIGLPAVNERMSGRGEQT